MKKNLSSHWRVSSPHRRTLNMKNGPNYEVKYPNDWAMRENSLGLFDDENCSYEPYESRKIVNILRNTGYILMISLGKYINIKSTLYRKGQMRFNKGGTFLDRHE